MNDSEVVQKTIAYVKETLREAEGGHDWFHIERVYKNSLLIAKGQNVNLLVVSLGALLHDIADSKFHEGDEAIGPELARNFLNSMPLDQAIIEHVVKIIENISFKNSIANNALTFHSEELDVVEDADRLDAIGAIGIARAFHFGGFKNRKIYDPGLAPNLNMSKEEYKKAKGPTINHFYEKLLLLKDKLKTKTGKKLAEKRHAFMLEYLNHFYEEWDGKA